MLKPHVFRKVVGTAGDQERLTNADIFASYVRIQAEDDNTGVVFIGDSEVSSALGIELKVSTGAVDSARNTQHMELFAYESDLISLRDIWIDAATAADGVIVFYLMRD